MTVQLFCPVIPSVMEASMTSVFQSVLLLELFMTIGHAEFCSKGAIISVYERTCVTIQIQIVTYLMYLRLL